MDQQSIQLQVQVDQQSKDQSQDEQTEEGEQTNEEEEESEVSVKVQKEEVDVPKKLFNSPSQFLANKLIKITKKNTKKEFPRFQSQPKVRGVEMEMPQQSYGQVQFDMESDLLT